MTGIHKAENQRGECCTQRAGLLSRGSPPVFSRVLMSIGKLPKAEKTAKSSVVLTQGQEYFLFPPTQMGRHLTHQVAGSR